MKKLNKIFQKSFKKWQILIPRFCTISLANSGISRMNKKFKFLQENERFIFHKISGKIVHKSCKIVGWFLFEKKSSNVVHISGKILAILAQGNRRMIDWYTKLPHITSKDFLMILLKSQCLVNLRSKTIICESSY